MRFVFGFLIICVVAQTSAADELGNLHQPLISMTGSFEVTWSVEQSNAHSFRHIVDGVTHITLFNNYVMLQTDDGGHLISRDRLIDLKWVGQGTMTSPSVASPSPVVEHEPERQPEAEPEAEPIPAAYLSYAEGLVKKYDANEDGILQREEWEQLSGDPASADADGDGQITTEEYARSLMKR